MPKLVAPLTDIQVRTAKPKDKQYKLTDGGGLYLLVKPTGARYWRMGYRFAGTEKLLAFGKYPEVTLLDARNKRAAARKQIASGVDPSHAKRIDKINLEMVNTNTFEAVAREWHENKMESWQLSFP